jgi:sugar phosphate isomerase/epimerase
MITYCTNIHRGESWDEVFRNVRAHVPAVKEAVSPCEPFPIGLRLSSRASAELSPGDAAGFAAWCEEHGMLVPSINGFPYGPFHGTPVKEQVYLPDWRLEERVRYTERLAVLLDAWLPVGVAGSISTVPIGWKGHVRPEDYDVVRKNLMQALEGLARLRDRSGKEIVLALEPEPGCVLETAADVCRFFADMSFPAETAGLIGICYDCCHQAVAFEDPAASLAALAAAGIRIAKVQASSAPCFADPGHGSMAAFAEPVYLHQVVVRRDGGALAKYDDLPEALAGHKRRPGDEWRCHYHLPLDFEGGPGVGTTRWFLEALLPLLPPETLLEVETYTWEVLPPALRRGGVAASIVRELRWLEGRVHAADRRH